MDFGILQAFRNPQKWARPMAELYQEQIEDAVIAEQLGFGHVWTTEHHFYPDAWASSILPILAAMAAKTTKIRLGTYIVILPLHNPLRVAEDAMTVDIISNGRLDLGVGPGAEPAEFEGFGVPRKERLSRMHEGLEIVRRAFTESSLSFDGKYNRFRDVAMTLKPIQKPHPPLWVAAVGEKAVRMAAERGYHLAASGPTHSQQLYDATLRSVGRNPSDYSIAQLMISTYVAKTHEDAWNDAEESVHYVLSSYQNQFKRIQATHGDSLLNRQSKIPPMPAAKELRNTPGLTFFGAPILVGSPEEVREMIERYRSATRITHMVCWMQLPGLSAAKARSSMELFASRIMPHFRN